MINAKRAREQSIGANKMAEAEFWTRLETLVSIASFQGAFKANVPLNKFELSIIGTDFISRLEHEFEFKIDYVSGVLEISW